MTAPTPTERLTRAAARLRGLAEAATPGPWHGVTGPGGYPNEVRTGAEGRAGIPVLFDPSHLIGTAHYMRGQDAHYIAALHPGVALAVADLLDDLAQDVEMQSPGGDLRDHWDMRIHIAAKWALAVADAIGGRE